jgi:hypothetical protein
MLGFKSVPQDLFLRNKFRRAAVRVEADKSVQHVVHESKRAACEVLLMNGREVPAYDRSGKGAVGTLPKGVGAVPGMRAVGSLAYASVYEQSQFSEAGRAAPAEIPFYLERRLECGQRDPKTGKMHDLWVTDNGWGKPGRTLTLQAALGLAEGHVNSRVVVRDAWGRYNVVGGKNVPQEQSSRPGPRPAGSSPAPKSKLKGAAGMW